MKIIFLGSFVDNSLEYQINKNNLGLYTISATTFQRAFISGFKNNRNNLAHICNAADIASYPTFKKLRMPPITLDFDGFQGDNCGYCNLLYWKRASISQSLYKNMLSYIENNISENEQVVILVYSMIYQYINAAVRIKIKYKNIRICCIVADLPEYFTDNKSILGNIDSWITTKVIYNLTKKIDSFVLLTKQMSDIIPVGDRPSLTMEGIFNEVDIEFQAKHAKTILYSGKLDLRFGIDKLLESFSKITDPDFRLWICGNGMARNVVEQYAKVDDRIIYWGVLPQQKVFELQRQASLLINPRSNDGEYTKYSFPSKTMEYMASGTPTIMYKLHGVPIDYDPYLVFIDDYISIEDVLIKWGNKDQDYLNDFGLKAKNFILEHKNSQVQASRVYNFLSALYEK